MPENVADTSEDLRQCSDSVNRPVEGLRVTQEPLSSNKLKRLAASTSKQAREFKARDSLTDAERARIARERLEAMDGEQRERIGETIMRELSSSSSRARQIADEALLVALRPRSARISFERLLVATAEFEEGTLQQVVDTLYTIARDPTHKDCIKAIAVIAERFDGKAVSRETAKDGTERERIIVTMQAAPTAHAKQGGETPAWNDASPEEAHVDPSSVSGSPVILGVSAHAEQLEPVRVESVEAVRESEPTGHIYDALRETREAFDGRARAALEACDRAVTAVGPIEARAESGDEPLEEAASAGAEPDQWRVQLAKKKRRDRDAVQRERMEARREAALARIRSGRLADDVVIEVEASPMRERVAEAGLAEEMLEEED